MVLKSHIVPWTLLGSMVTLRKLKSKHVHQGHSKVIQVQPSRIGKLSLCLNGKSFHLFKRILGLGLYQTDFITLIYCQDADMCMRVPLGEEMYEYNVERNERTQARPT